MQAVSIFKCAKKFFIRRNNILNAGEFYLYTMADVHTKEQRRFNMQQIRSSNTKPELLVRQFLFAKGYRYKLHDKKLPGKPDIVLPEYYTEFFVPASVIFL